jgi:predicted enzyme related to lactoylglutathione lyase
MHGQFFWYDLMTTDVDAAGKFYADVVGWGLQKQTAPGTDYTLFLVNDQGAAGLMPIPAEAATMGARPCWTGYIAVDDVDKAVKELQEAGGIVHRPPSEVPGIIRFAVVADPQGARFIVARGLGDRPPPPEHAFTPGLVGWRELYAGEWTAAFAFYEKLFGWTKADAIDMGPMGVYQLFKTGESDAAGGMMTKPDMIPMAYWGYYFIVPTIDAAAARVTAGGGKVVNGPMEVPGGQWIVQCTDPQGAYFSLVGPTR